MNSKAYEDDCQKYRQSQVQRAESMRVALAIPHASMHTVKELSLEQCYSGIA